MKRTTVLTVMLLAVLIVMTTALAVFAANETGGARSTAVKFEIYTSDPESGAAPAHTETASTELASMLMEYVNKGDTWIKLNSDATLSFTAIYYFKNSLYIDLGGHKLTLGSGNTDKTLAPNGSLGQVLEIKNGTLTSVGAKFIYPIGSDARPDIRFTDLTIDVTNDFSDHRAGGKLSFTRCNVRFMQNSIHSTTCNRFIFFGQRTGIGNIDVEITDCHFTASKDFKWSNSQSTIFNFGNGYGNHTNLTVKGTTFDMGESTLPRFFANANNATATVNLSDSKFYGDMPFLTSSSSGTTEVKIGDGVAFNKEGMDASTLNGATVSFPDSYELVWLDCENVEYVAPENTVKVSYYNGEQKLGERLSKIGAVPYWDITVDFGGALVYSDGVLYSAAVGFFADSKLENEATVITKETTELYVGAGRGEPCAWAAFSSATPSLDTLVSYSTTDGEVIGAVNDTTVKLIEGYGDITLTHTAAPYSLTRDLTIDVKGNTLNLSADNTDKAFNPQSGVTLAIKNATVVSATARLVYPGAKPTNVSTNVILENVKMNWTAVTMFDYRAGGGFTARNCEFDFASNVTFAFNVLHKRENLTLDMTFEDCIINTGARLATPFITVSQDALNCKVNISFNGCSFNAPDGQAIVANKSTSTAVSVNINRIADAHPTYVDINVPLVTAATAGNTTLTVGEGVYLNAPLEDGYIQSVSLDYANSARVAHSAKTEYPYVVTAEFSAVSFVNGDTVTKEYYELGYVGTLNSTKTYLVITENGVKKVAEQATAWSDADGKIISTFIPTDGMTLYGTSIATGNYATWVIFNADESEIVSHSLLDGNSAQKLPASTATLLPEGGILRLYADVTYTVVGSGIQNITLAKGATVDLGGHTLTMTDLRFFNSSVEGHYFTVKNGTLDATLTSNNILNANIGTKGHVIFEGVRFVTRSGMTPFDIRGGGLYLTDCQYDGSAQFIALSSRYTVGAPIYVVMDGCNIKCADLLSVVGSEFGNPTPPYTTDIDVIIKDTTAECGYLICVSGGITEASVIDLVFDGVSIKSSAEALNYIGVDATVNASFTDCRFSHDPCEVISGYGFDTVTLPKGLAIIQTDSFEYPFAVGIPVVLKWNFSLENDVRVGFLLEREGINYVKLNGTELPLSEMTLIGEIYAFALDAVSLNMAAESFDIEVGYGDGYSVSYTRSIVDYAQGILASKDSAATKRLVASVMNYVNSAYVYALTQDSTAPTVPTALSTLLKSEQYLAYAPTGDVELGGGVDMGNISLAFASAQLNLTSEIELRLNLNGGFSGTVVIGDTTFTVINGMDTTTCHTYIELRVDAHSLLSYAIAVSGATGDGTEINGAYSLSTYLGAVKGNSNTETSALLDAIVAYSTAAREYREERTILNNFIYEKHGNSYVIVGVKDAIGAIVIPEVLDGIYITEIGEYAFANKTEITSVVIPTSVKTIGIGAFMNCTSLKSLTISEGVEVIGARAFEGIAVTQLTVPDSTLAIGMGVFASCDSLESLTLPFVGAYRADSNNYFGYIFGAPSYVANAQYVPATLHTVIFSDNATRVPAYSFWGCSGIKTILLGNGVNSIGISAFSGCEMLTTIYIPETVISIPASGYYYNSPFFGCSEELVIVTGATDVSAYGKYWSNTAQDKTAQVVTGVTYEEYLREYLETVQ